VLTIFVVYAFLNSWRSTLITALSLPTSVLAAFIAVWLCGFTLNFMTLLGLSLAIGVLIDDAIVVRENIVRHMENGADRRTAALEGTAEIGMAVASTTFSIMAVFIPVAFMPGISGEWFRPFALTVTCSVMVSLFISFTLDPMLSAYWGDPPGHHHAPKKGISRTWPLQRLVRPPGRPLRQRDRLGAAPPPLDGVIAVGSLVGASACTSSSAAPASCRKDDGNKMHDRGAHPGLVERGVCALKMEGGRAGAHPAGNQGHQQSSTPAAADLCRHRQAHTSASAARRDRGRAARPRSPPGRRRVHRARRPERRRQAGADRVHRPDSRKLMELTNAYMDKLRQVPGAVDVGLSQQDPKNELQIELDRGLANIDGHVGRRRRHRAARGLRRHRSGRLGRPDRRNPRRRGAPASGRPRQHREHRAPADRRHRHQHDGAARADRPITMGKGPSEIEHKDGKRVITVSANAQGRSPAKSRPTP
jgi:hypothetical protein